MRNLALFPITTAVVGQVGNLSYRVETTPVGERLTIAGCDLAELAGRHGTPLYVYDGATLDAAANAYRQALADSYPAASGLTYAGKAYLCIAIAQWTQRHELWLDCTGVGELRVAIAAGVHREHILVHGVNKSQADLAAAAALVGTIVVDNLSELDHLIALFQQINQRSNQPNLWLRLRPGLAVETHTYTQTGQSDSKFGMSPAEALEAARLCRKHQLPLTGLHFHQGSHFHDPAPLAPALETALDLMTAIYAEDGWKPGTDPTLCPGGGWGVAYHEEALPHPAIETYVRFLAENLVAGCGRRGLPLPRLQLEPGRSLVARAGVALYRVGAVKQTAGRRWLLLDGGLADNPRPALYGARYSALPVWQPRRPAIGPAWLAGPYCESSDVLIEGCPMPQVEAGELIAVPVSGAYQLSMASNYNGACRPAALWLEAGGARLIQRRETPDDLLRRDLPLWPSVEGNAQ